MARGLDALAVPTEIDESDVDDDEPMLEEELCDHFEYQNTGSCWVCNGYYGPNFGEPICGTCHSFLYAPPPEEEHPPLITNVSDDEDSGNDEPLFEDRERQEREGEDEEEPECVEMNEDNADGQISNDNTNIFHTLPQPEPVRTVNNYLDVLSQPYEISKSEANVSLLPVEVLLSIFSYLDDISLYNASEVCPQWRQIIKTHTPQSMWRKYTKERWPLFHQVVKISDWFKLYGGLISSCFCRTCVIKMALKTPSQGINIFRMTRLRGDVRSLDATSGVDAVPLDHNMSHWQASILGPDGSPYEGGKFFLYIEIPLHYPMCPPNVRFLTKIIHPNVSRHGDVGIDIIQHNWSLALTISKLLLSVQSLLTDPFTDICMEPELGRMYENDRSRFETLARQCTWKYAMYDLMVL